MHSSVKCLYSIAIYFAFIFSETLLHKSIRCSEGLLVMSILSFAALCTDETHVGSPLLASHRIACRPECLK